MVGITGIVNAATGTDPMAALHQGVENRLMDERSAKIADMIVKGYAQPGSETAVPTDSLNTEERYCANIANGVLAGLDPEHFSVKPMPGLFEGGAMGFRSVGVVNGLQSGLDARLQQEGYQIVQIMQGKASPSHGMKGKEEVALAEVLGKQLTQQNMNHQLFAANNAQLVSSETPSNTIDHGILQDRIHDVQMQQEFATSR